MIKLNKINLSKTRYLNTFLIAFILAALVVTGALISARVSVDDELYITKESQTKFRKKFTESILSQEEFLGKIYSDDYKYNIYIAGLYRNIGNFEKSEYHYKQAIFLAPDATYEHYLKLIALYLEYDKPEEAEKICSSISDKNSQKLIKFKCNANILMGNYYYKHNNPMIASKKYKLAIYYFEKLNRRIVKIREYIENGLLASYVKIADDYVNERNYSEAYRYLRRAEQTAPKDLIVKYKLALVLSYIKPENAIKYYDYIKSKQPQIISSYLYYETLMRSAEINKAMGKLPEAKLYTYKADSVKNFYKNNIINSDNIKFDFLYAKVQTSRKSDKFIIKFRMGNISSFVINNLQMEVMFYKKGQLAANYSRTLFEKGNSLHPGQISPIITIIHNSQKHYKKIDYEDVSFDIYIYKNPKYKTLIYKGNFAGCQVSEF